MAARLSPKQLLALQAVAEGRVRYGNPYPNRARRAAARGGFPGTPQFLVDGSEPYGQDKQTLPVLEERGLVRVRHEDVAMVRVPETAKQRHSVSGLGEEFVVPAHDEPADAGWQVAVELTAAGRDALGG